MKKIVLVMLVWGAALVFQGGNSLDAFRVAPIEPDDHVTPVQNPNVPGIRPVGEIGCWVEIRPNCASFVGVGPFNQCGGTICTRTLVESPNNDPIWIWTCSNRSLEYHLDEYDTISRVIPTSPGSAGQSEFTSFTQECGFYKVCACPAGFAGANDNRPPCHASLTEIELGASFDAQVPSGPNCLVPIGN